MTVIVTSAWGFAQKMCPSYVTLAHLTHLQGKLKLVKTDEGLNFEEWPLEKKITHF
jgi:hypothetical protein